MLDFDAGKYGFYVWVAYGATAIVFVALIVSSLLHAGRWRRKARDLGWGDR